MTVCPSTPPDLLVTGFDGEIRIRGGGLLEAPLARLCPGWRSRRAAAGEEGHAAVHVRQGSDGDISVQLPTTEPRWERYESTEDAAFLVVNLVLRAMLESAPNHVMLHAAALVGPGGQALTLIGETHAGKSTLTLLLAQAGWCILGDDVVAVEAPDGQARIIGLGLAPKIRQPLPARIAERAGPFAEQRRAATVANVDYLHPKTEELSPFGTDDVPLGQLVRLQRAQPGEPHHANLQSARRPDLVRSLTANLFAPELRGRARLGQTLTLAASAPGWTLDFNDSLAAADLLLDRFRTT